MLEFAGYDRARTTTTSHSAAQHAPAQTPEQVAHSAVGSVKWRVNQVVHAKVELDRARTANDPARWRDARQELDQALARAHEELERNADRVTAGTEADRVELEHAKAAIATSVQLAAAAEPPLGYVEVAGENALLAAVRGADPDTAIEPTLDAMTSTDLRIVRERIARHRANDTLAEAIWSLGPERRGRGNASEAARLARMDRPYLLTLLRKHGLRQ